MVGPDRVPYWDDVKQPEVYAAPWPAIPLNDTRDTRDPQELGLLILGDVRVRKHSVLNRLGIPRITASQAADRLG